MTMKRSARKEELKDRILEVAGTLIAEGGLKGLRARDIADRANVALGSLYTVFADLDELILHVNSGTLKDMEAALRNAVAADADDTPALERLAAAYLGFALANRHRWAALFEHRMPDGAAVPLWHLQEHAFLIELIIAPLGALMPGSDPERLALRARTLFAAVHGVIGISLENRFIGLSSDVLEREVRALAGILSRGMETAPPGAA